jgi:hypothetical protein
MRGIQKICSYKFSIIWFMIRMRVYEHGQSLKTCLQYQIYEFLLDIIEFENSQHMVSRKMAGNNLAMITTRFMRFPREIWDLAKRSFLCAPNPADNIIMVFIYNVSAQSWPGMARHIKTEPTETVTFCFGIPEKTYYVFEPIDTVNWIDEEGICTPTIGHVTIYFLGNCWYAYSSSF